MQGYPTGGIGSATAKLLAARGDKVVLAARRRAELAQVAEQRGEGAALVVTDVTHRADVEHLRDEVVRGFGHAASSVRLSERQSADSWPASRELRSLGTAP